MKIRPILFSTPMVEAIMEKRKTKTRRTQGLEKINEDPERYMFWKNGDIFNVDDLETLTEFELVPKFKAGDILWVRETWQKAVVGYIYKAKPKNQQFASKWKPSIFMPKVACRNFLECINVGVERLQDISEKDAIAEGVGKYFDTEFYVMYGSKNDWAVTAFASFAYLWGSINGKESWESNPWVWVYDFKPTKRPTNF
jgi:hypothetical protein